MYRRLALAIALLGTVAVGAQGLGLSGASFAGTTSNPSNQFQSAGSFTGLRLATGSYTGNGTDNRSITGIGFQPDVVIVKGNAFGVAVLRSSTMSGDASKPLAGTTALTANLIQSLDTNGFTLGDDFR